MQPLLVSDELLHKFTGFNDQDCLLNLILNHGTSSAPIEGQVTSIYTRSLLLRLMVCIDFTVSAEQQVEGFQFFTQAQNGCKFLILKWFAESKVGL